MEKPKSEGEARSLLRETADSWQDEYAQTLNDQDAREILSNVCAFFDLLGKWSSKGGAASLAPQASEAAQPGAGNAPGLVITRISTRRRIK